MVSIQTGENFGNINSLMKHAQEELMQDESVAQNVIQQRMEEDPSILDEQDAERAELIEAKVMEAIQQISPPPTIEELQNVVNNLSN